MRIDALGNLNVKKRNVDTKFGLEVCTKVADRSDIEDMFIVVVVRGQRKGQSVYNSDSGG